MCPVYYTSFFVFFSNGLNEYLHFSFFYFFHYNYLQTPSPLQPSILESSPIIHEMNQSFIKSVISLKSLIFVAIQEVRDTEILDRTVSMLKNQFNLNYKYLASPKIGRKVKEIYAFLYRTDKVEYLQESYTVSDEKDLFIREPFFAKFKAGNFDFYVISIHIIWGDSFAERKAEALLLDDVYLAVQNLNDENDILLMGDFNLGPDDKGFVELLEISDMIVVNEKIPTSIKDRLYDNIFFQSNYTKEFTGSFGVMKFDEQLFDNDDKKASLMVSDHRPLWAVFDVGRDED